MNNRNEFYDHIFITLDDDFVFEYKSFENCTFKGCNLESKKFILT